jgi:hypothetical protein
MAHILWDIAELLKILFLSIFAIPSSRRVAKKRLITLFDHLHLNITPNIIICYDIEQYIF